MYWSANVTAQGSTGVQSETEMKGDVLGQIVTPIYWCLQSNDNLSKNIDLLHPPGPVQGPFLGPFQVSLSCVGPVHRGELLFGWTWQFR